MTNERTYQWSLGWGAWDEYTQYRRPETTRGEFRTRPGRDVPDPEVGHVVHYPVCFLRDNAGAILLKRCAWVSEARFPVEELSRPCRRPGL